MKTHVNDNRTPPKIPPIVLEAADWLICLKVPAAGPHDPYRDVAARDHAFLIWTQSSPAHRRAFMEMMELERRVRGLDTETFNRILRSIDTGPATTTAIASWPDQARQTPVTPRARSTSFRTWAVAAILVAVVCIGLGAFLRYHSGGTHVYATKIGEQHQYGLPDGSSMQLNTDTQVTVDFSPQGRMIHLARGEALFSVKSDSQRPFLVTADRATARVLGTEFNVHRKAQSVEVLVLSGTVKVSAAAAPEHASSSAAHKNPGQPESRTAPAGSELILSAGEMAEITPGHVAKVEVKSVTDAMLWRQGKAKYVHARLVDVVADLNRYNDVHIVVEGAAAQETRVSGTFNLEGYRDILLFAQRLNTLSVEADGNGWVIRSRK